MIRLPFIPTYFPLLLLPVYWVYWLCFYVFYIPIYFLIWLFSPYSPRKSEDDPFAKRPSKMPRTMEVEEKKIEENEAE